MSRLAPIDACPFGEDYVSQKLITITLTKPKMRCEQVFELIEANGHSISGYCANKDFSNVCCQSCKSKTKKDICRIFKTKIIQL